MTDRYNRRRGAGEGGFTLIELLVVIIILGILAAVVVFAVGGVGDKGQAAACKIDTRTIRTAEEAYSAQPTSAGGGGGTYIGSTAAKDETALITAGFLSENSGYHYVSNVVAPVLSTNTPGSFKIFVQQPPGAGSTPACGTADADVDASATDGNL